MTCAIRGPIATARAKLEKSICPAFVTVARFLDIPSYSLDKLCNYWRNDARFVSAMFYFSLKYYSEDINKESSLFGTPMYIIF